MGGRDRKPLHCLKDTCLKEMEGRGAVRFEMEIGIFKYMPFAAQVPNRFQVSKVLPYFSLLSMKHQFPK